MIFSLLKFSASKLVNSSSDSKIPCLSAVFSGISVLFESCSSVAAFLVSEPSILTSGKKSSTPLKLSFSASLITSDCFEISSS